MEKMESQTKRIRIIVALIAVLVVAAVIGMVVYSGSSSQKIRKQLDLGQKYLTELKYEEAVAAFKEALDIDPNNTDAIAGITKAYGEWSSKLVADQDFESAVARLDEARNLLPDNQDLIDKEVDVYLAWIDSFVDSEDYKRAQEIAAEGYEKLGDERLKSKLDELNAKIDEIESEEALIKAKCTLIYYGDMAGAIADEHKFETVYFEWEHFGVRFSEPVEFINQDDGSTVVLTEANIGLIPVQLGEVVDGKMVLNDEYFDKEWELFFYPYTYIPDYFTYTGDELAFMRYEDDGAPRYKILPLGPYYVSVADESEEILKSVSKQNNDSVTNNSEEQAIDTSDLANFLGADEQEILKAFPEAQKQGEGGDAYYMVEGEIDDFAIAGPFFYLDSSAKVIEVGYSGNKYAVNKVYKGMNAQEVIAGLEADGWVIREMGFTNGSGTCNVVLTKGNLEYYLDTDQFDAPFNFDKSDLTGNIDRMYLSRN